MRNNAISVARVLFAASLLFAFGSAQAADVYTPKFKLTRVWVNDNGDLHLYTNINEGDYNPIACTSPNNFAVDRDHVAYEQLYSLALSAYYADKYVEVRVSDNACVGNDPMIAWISVSN